MLTTLETVKGDLGYTDTASDARLQRYIAEASSRIEGWCGQALKEAAASHKERWPGASILLPPDGKVAATIAVTAVTVNGETLAAENYELDGAILYRLSDDGSRICWGTAVAQVSYTAGYILPGNTGANLPAEIERACIDLVKDLDNSRDRDSFVRSESYSDGTAQSYGTMGAAAAVFDLKRGPLVPYRKWAPV